MGLTFNVGYVLKASLEHDTFTYLRPTATRNINRARPCLSLSGTHRCDLHERQWKIGVFTGARLP